MHVIFSAVRENFIIKILGDIRKKGFEDTGKVDKIFEGSYQYLKLVFGRASDKFLQLHGEV